ncbi:hypothetical protein LJC68_03355 [Bacteroidales bacterium OttesenSCG-928-B11]|nr:hypothetical protein [Bacteroidales bacterium OttesenSCG-928-B11]
MEKSNRQAEILILGKKIIKELSNEDDDRLALLEKWMGHYIAELIDKAENAKTEKERTAFQKECFDTILKLWDKRSTLSIESLPLGRIKIAIDILNEIQRQKNIWEQMRFANPTSWESLAVKIHDAQMDAIRICIQAAIAENAMEQEKVWVNEYSETLSSEEKEIIEKLDYFLEEPSPAIIYVFDDDKVDSKKVEKSKIEKAFDRLESINEEQKKAIQKLKETLAKQVL